MSMFFKVGYFSWFMKIKEICFLPRPTPDPARAIDKKIYSLPRSRSPKRGRVKGSLYLMRNEKQEVFQQTHPSVEELKKAYT